LRIFLWSSQKSGTLSCMQQQQAASKTRIFLLSCCSVVLCLVADNFVILCFIHPIFRYLFLVTIGDKVSKKRKYYVVFVYILQGKMGKTEKTGKKITKVTKILKTKRRKYGMNETLVSGSHFAGIKLSFWKLLHSLCTLSILFSLFELFFPTNLIFVFMFKTLKS
jgi:hypothetical protein